MTSFLAEIPRDAQRADKKEIAGRRRKKGL